jgi:hypothetical protein
METYCIVRGADGWAISQNMSQPEGSYATKEIAFEAAYLAASNDIKKGLGISITVDPPRRGDPVMGGRA